MERLTTNKNVSEMGMFKLALNCCYITQDGNTRYRDYAKDIDARDFARVITENFAKDVLPLNDESFDEEMMENLMYDPLTDINALIAVFYGFALAAVSITRLIAIDMIIARIVDSTLIGVMKNE